MRFTAAFLSLSLLSTAVALSSDTVGRRRAGGVVRENSSIAMTTTPEESIARKRKSPGAPLVDSALLRFVSLQKKQQGQSSRSVSSSLDDSISKPEATGSRDTTTTASVASSFGGDSGSSSSSSSSLSGTGIDPIDPWMGQFNRNRIAQKLVALGADEELALQAGEKLQSNLLIRTARRRIRMFLRERDSLWNDNTAGGLISNSSRLVASGVVPGSADLKSPNYGLDDVLDVFIENGFTGTDICAILTHTPSLALMMPRKSFADDVDSEIKTGGEDDEDGEEEPVNGSSSSSSSSGRSLVSSSGETLEQTIARSFRGLLITTLGMRKYDARKVMRNCPGLLSVRGSKSAVQIVAMMTQLGVSTNSIARDKASLPTLLSRPPADVFRLISFLSSDAVRMPIRKIGPLIRRDVSRELLDTIAPVPKIHHLQQAVSSESSSDGGDEESGELDPELQSAIWGKTREERNRKINQVYKNMTEVVWVLRHEIGTKNIGQIVAAYPSVLLLDANRKILPTALYLVNELGIPSTQVASLLQLFPVLLGMEFEDFDKISEYLQSLGVKQEDLGKIFRAFPKLLTMDIEEQMVPVVDYLTSIGIENLGAFITSLPAVLGYSVEKDLVPKWEYLNKVCLQARFELVKFPAYFSYPFGRVIKTRYDYLAAKEIPRQLLPVDAVLRHGDVEFATKIARDLDGGKVFQVFSKNRRRKRENQSKLQKEEAKKAKTRNDQK